MNRKLIQYGIYYVYRSEVDKKSGKPVVIVSSDSENWDDKITTVAVLPITHKSTDNNDSDFNIVVNRGLMSGSVTMPNKIETVRKSLVGDFVGAMDSSVVSYVQESLKKWLCLSEESDVDDVEEYVDRDIEFTQKISGLYKTKTLEATVSTLSEENQRLEKEIELWKEAYKNLSKLLLMEKG